jgi:hypothetical protein
MKYSHEVASIIVNSGTFADSICSQGIIYSSPTTLSYHPSPYFPYKTPHATTAATTPLPSIGPILLAAPELVAGGALPAGLGLAWTFETATPLTPVAFLHWSSERSWAEELNLMSAHCAW